MKIKVSVIIPYFKSENTIDRAINSILNQTVSVYEIIIINDFSNTIEDTRKLKKLESEILNLKVIDLEENRGPGYARNMGIKLAKGDYIAFLDSDDSWTRKKIENQIKIMRDKKAFLSAHLSSNTEARKKSFKKYKYISFKTNLIRNKIATRSVMMINSKEYWFDSHKRYAEDFLLWSHILYDKRKVLIINETMAHSYKNDYGEAGLTSNLLKMHNGVIDVYTQLYEDNKIHILDYKFLILLEKIKQIYRLHKVRSRENN
ncbi:MULTISPECIES: glycosyltransferase family 2 protein [Staphylococcus]|uniref:glycosyltransferase family 2 protein n=1 Tax=Staphylococcus TaxID=1279 RepID=UPI001AEC4B9C|nr:MULTISPECIES: glycosyltransferase family 2 protein [Staphylococcus]MCD9063411.1 glycosyltransferase family 2 protein [Staphylococcus saprophyticus]MDW4447390.1 glycosyltransferase family 2 protein [Staphylococcus saprophyticus]